MIIEQYGIALKRLTADKIELVRRWRNDPKISKYMEFREIITPEMQHEWFKKIDNDTNYYFLITVNEEEIGLINIRDIDFKKGTGEGGIFIYADKYLNSDISFRSVLCINDFAFDYLSLDYLTAHILSDNVRAIKYNKAIGYELQKGQESIYNQKYILTKEQYLKKKKIIKRLLE